MTSANATRHANTTPLSETANAVIIHNCSAWRPNSAYGTVNRNGSGFHDGAPLVSSLPWIVRCPQTSQPYGS